MVYGEIRGGRGKAIDKKDHTLKNIIPKLKRNRGMRHNGKGKLNDMTVFTLNGAILFRGI